MKRSKGVTVLAIFLLLAGTWMVLGNVLMWVQGPHAAQRFEEQVRQLEAQRDALAQQGNEQQISQADIRRVQGQLERLITVLRRLAEEQRKLQASATMQVLGGLSALLGLAALWAGFGILTLQERARKLLLWQAALSIPVGLASLAVFMRFHRSTMELMLELTSASGVPLQVQHTMRSGQVVGEWLGAATIVGWNAFLWWFFRRPSVKAQFSPS